jgi:hypothetical protein
MPRRARPEIGRPPPARARCRGVGTRSIPARLLPACCPGPGRGRALPAVRHARLGVDLGSRVALVGSAVPQDRVRVGFTAAPEGPPVAEQVPQGCGDDVRAGPLGGLHRDDPWCPAAGHDVAVAGVELLLLDVGADGGGVVGDLVDGHQVRLASCRCYWCRVPSRPGPTSTLCVGLVMATFHWPSTIAW